MRGFGLVGFGFGFGIEFGVGCRWGERIWLAVYRERKSGIMNICMWGGRGDRADRRVVRWWMYWMVCWGMKYIFRLMPMKRVLGGLVGGGMLLCGNG